MRLTIFFRLLVIVAITLCALSSESSTSLAQGAPSLRVLNVSSAQTIGMRINERNVIVPIQGRMSETLALVEGNNDINLNFRSGSGGFGTSFFGIRAEAGERYLLVLYSSSSYLIVNESKFLTGAPGMAHVLLINGDIRTETITVSLKDGANIERYRSILVAERSRSRSGGGNALAHNVAAALFVTPTNYTISSTAGNATVQTNLMGGRVYIVIVSGRDITVLENN